MVLAKKGKGKEGRKKEKKKYKDRNGRMYRHTDKEGWKEGRKREKRGEAGEGGGGEQGVLCPLGGQRAQGLAAVGFTLSYRVRLHINPSLLPVSPGPC